MRDIPLKLIISAVSYEKGLSESFIFEAIEAALISATKHKYVSNINIKIKIDKKQGNYITYRIWNINNDINKNKKNFSELNLNIARTENQNIKSNDKIEELIDSIQFNRIAIQIAKQVIIQKIKDAEKKIIVKSYKEKIGKIITGTIKKITKNNLILNFENKIEGFLKKNDILQREIHRTGDAIKVYLYDVIIYKKKPQLIVNRSSDEMLIELLKKEVPEINDGIIEIKGIAREAGSRTKIAVKTNDGRVDPIGTCVGIKGIRIQSLSNELYGEKIDIILWDPNPVYFVLNAISPAIVDSIIVDNDTKNMELTIKENMLAQTIGKNGQNIKLAIILTKWKISIISTEEAKKRKKKEIKKNISMLSKKLGISKYVSFMLVKKGFKSLEEIAYISKKEFYALGLDNNIIDTIKEKARNILLFNEINENLRSFLLNFNLDKKIYHTLIKNNINSNKDLSKLNVDYLMKITQLPENQCNQLITKAKKSYYY